MNADDFVNYIIKGLKKDWWAMLDDEDSIKGILF